MELVVLSGDGETRALQGGGQWCSGVLTLTLSWPNPTHPDPQRLPGPGTEEAAGVGPKPGSEH